MKKSLLLSSLTLALVSASFLPQAMAANTSTNNTNTSSAKAAATNPAQADAQLAARRAKLKQLIALHWDLNMEFAPEYASVLGDKRFNDKLTDFSPAAMANGMKKVRSLLKELEALDANGFDEQEKINRELLIVSMRDQVEDERFKFWEMPILQNMGPHLDLPQVVSMLSFESVKDYEDYLARLNGVPELFKQVMVQMRNGMQNGRIPPRVLLEKIPKQCQSIIDAKAEKSPFAQPLKNMPASFAVADKERLQKAILAAIEKKVVPAYQQLQAFVQDEYQPKGRTEVGFWALPDGAAAYASLVRQSTTTDMSPDEIHTLGLKEVARIEAEMMKIAQQLGYQDLQKFRTELKKNPALMAKSRQDILDQYQSYTDQIYPQLEKMFGRLPKARLQIKPIEEFREKSAAAAQYMQPPGDGSRPGLVMVNTGDFSKRNTYTIESTALHEGVPGHHMQMAIATELPELPAFRKNAVYTAYVEGWALYAESLGYELGAYKNPYNRYGNLQAEMLRAIRLVVDTGLHHKKWSRQQVVDFFHAHSGIDEVEVQSETDRYIANPGQALGYKVGQLKIRQLREQAQRELGKQFDIRAFHDVVLGNGALPLAILEKQVQNWVVQQKNQQKNLALNQH